MYGRPEGPGPAGKAWTHTRGAFAATSEARLGRGDGGGGSGKGGCGGEIEGA